MSLGSSGGTLFPISQGAKNEKKKSCRLGETCFLLLEKEPENKLPVANSPPEFPGDTDT